MSDEGNQRELVLGNKQLLSVFFVVVALMGVAFTIGYIIGRNTTAVNVSANTGGGTAAPSRPPVVNTPTPPDNPQVQEPPPASQPTPETPAPKGRTATHAAKPYEDGAKTSSPDASQSETTPTTKPEGGTYLQVAALKRVDADHVLKVLRDRRFPALLGESPKEGLYRVLVGPFHDMPSLADSKQKLRAAGFEPIVAK